MEWYCSLTDHLFNPWGIEANGGSVDAILDTLRKRVVHLYRKLLLFLMQSVCSYYRHQGVVFVKNITDLNNKWTTSLKHIKEDEAALRIDCDQLSNMEHRKTLQEKSDRADESMRLVHRTIRDFMDEQKQMRTTESDRLLLTELFVIDPSDDMDAIEMRKDALLDDAFKWILDVPEFKAFTNDIDTDDGASVSPSPCRLLWIKGPAGTGKTMLLLGIIRELSERSVALNPGIAHFFFQNADNTVNSSMAAVRSLVWMLLHQQPHLLRHLRDKYENTQPSFVGRHAFIGLCKVLQNMLRDPELEPVYFIVDALDECDDGLPELIDLIARSLTITDKVNWLVSSRPSVPLGTCVAANALVELDSQRLEAPVHAYIHHQLARLQHADGYTDAIIGDMAHEITNRAHNTYLWVWFVFQRLTKPGKNGKTLNGMYALRVIQQFPPGLSALYDHIMATIERGEEDDPAYCKAALRAVYHAYRPLSLSELATFVDLPEGQVVRIVGECGSFLTLTNTTVGVIHQSANDYLTDNYLARLGPTGVAEGHADMGRLCLGAMAAGLHKNIYNLPGMGPYERNTPSPNPEPLAAVRYACVYWVDHIRDAVGQFDGSLLDTELIYSFLLEHLLHWLEALSLLNKIPSGLASIRVLRDLVPVEETSEFAYFVRDTLSFIMWNSYCIELSPLQTYASALLFSPRNSKVRRHFEGQHELDWIKTKPAVNENWEPYVQLNGHKHRVMSATFSPDGKQLVSGSVDETAKIWDVGSGMCICTLIGHTNNVNCVAFSLPDGKHVASGAWGGTIKIWDVASGDCIHTLRPRTYILTATSLAFSPTSDTQLACGFDKGIIEVWDVAMEECVRVLQAHAKDVTAVAFSPDGKQLMSSSRDGTTKVWDVASGLCLQTHEDDTNNTDNKKSACFSLRNENQLVARWADDIIRIWDTTHGHQGQTVEAAAAEVFKIVFSPNGTQLAAGSDDGTVTVWDAASGECIQTLKGHTALVTSVAFFPDGQQLASASHDGTAKVWNVASGQCVHTIEERETRVQAVAVLSNGQRLATLTDGEVVKIWSVSSWECMQTLSSYAHDLVVSPDAKLLCLEPNGEIEIWNVSSGERTLAVKGYKSEGMSRTFSPDGTKLAFQSDDNAIRVWDLLSQECIQTLEGSEHVSVTIVFSPDGKSLASVGAHGPVMVWDVTSGACTQAIEHFEGATISTVFAPSGTVERDGPGQIYGLDWTGPWIVKDGQPLLWLPSQYRSGLSFAINGQSIAVASQTGKVLVIEL